MRLLGPAGPGLLPSSQENFVHNQVARTLPLLPVSGLFKVSGKSIFRFTVFILQLPRIRADNFAVTLIFFNEIFPSNSKFQNLN